MLFWFWFIEDMNDSEQDKADWMPLNRETVPAAVNRQPSNPVTVETRVLISNNEEENEVNSGGEQEPITPRSDASFIHHI